MEKFSKCSKVKKIEIITYSYLIFLTDFKFVVQIYGAGPPLPRYDALMFSQLKWYDLVSFHTLFAGRKISRTAIPQKNVINDSIFNQLERSIILKWAEPVYFWASSICTNFVFKTDTSSEAFRQSGQVLRSSWLLENSWKQQLCCSGTDVFLLQISNWSGTFRYHATALPFLILNVQNTCPCLSIPHLSIKFVLMKTFQGFMSLSTKSTQCLLIYSKEMVPAVSNQWTISTERI